MPDDRFTLALARWRDRVALWRSGATEEEVRVILRRRYPTLNRKKTNEA